MARLFGTDGVRGIATWNLHRNLLLNWGALLRLTSAGKHAILKSLLGATHAFPAPCWKLLLRQVSVLRGAMRTFWV